MRILKTVAILLICLNFSCINKSSKYLKVSADEKLASAEKQFALLLKDAEKANRIPRTLDKKGNMHWARQNFDWTEGFFPGSCWYLYEETKDDKWKNAAEKFQALFEDHKHLTTNHDLGFVFNCSFGNGYRLTKNEAFKEVLITAADSLLTRFNPNVGCIKSWDVDKGWQAERGWKFPVIVDNMMNLELLFKVSEFSGDSKYKDVAITHANTTIKNHFRDNNSSVHVVDYDPETGEVRGKYTAQGYANESSWARGQAWGLYGYTVCYRFTKDKTYLDQAEKIANYILNFEDTPEDGTLQKMAFRIGITMRPISQMNLETYLLLLLPFLHC
jgi:rhamnogalacturonyl hydrolase YesR